MCASSMDHYGFTNRKFASVPRGYQQEYFGVTNNHRSAGSLFNYSDVDKRPSNPRSLEQLYFPKQSRIVCNFDVHLESPFFYAGDYITGQVTFDILNPATLRELEIRLLGSCTLQFSQSSSSPNKRAQQSASTILDVREDLLKERAEGLLLKPGRYSFEVSFKLPEELPSTNDVTGVSKNSEFQTGLTYHAQSQMTLLVDTMDGYSASTNLFSYKTYFHVERKICEEDLTPINYSITLGPDKGGHLALKMDRNIYRPGETVQLDLIVAREEAHFYNADLFLKQSVSIPSMKVTQTSCVDCQRGILFTQKKEQYKNLPTCTFKLNLPSSLKPSCDVALIHLTYFLEVNAVHRSKKLISIKIPLMIVNILQKDQTKKLTLQNFPSGNPSNARNTNSNITHKISSMKEGCSMQ